MRSTKPDLLRLVVLPQGPERTVMPDPRGTAPGRGAHLHPTAACLAMAERRRAFVRALRVQAPLDTGPVRDYLDAMPTRPSGPMPGDNAEASSTPGRPVGHDKEAEQSLMNLR